jgi:hypothetical protein
MTKNHFCTKFKENGDICGEKDKEKFGEGRYSICKECRKLETKRQRDKIKDEKKEEKITKIDPDDDLSWLIENKINDIKINKKSIPDYLEYLDDKIANFMEKEKRTNRFLLNEISKLIIKNKHLEDENIDMKTELQKIKKQIKSKNIDIKEENCSTGLPSLSEIFK